jgi:hypothetical protein
MNWPARGTCFEDPETGCTFPFHSRTCGWYFAPTKYAVIEPNDPTPVLIEPAPRLPDKMEEPMSEEEVENARRTTFSTTFFTLQ